MPIPTALKLSVWALAEQQVWITHKSILCVLSDVRDEETGAGV